MTKILGPFDTGIGASFYTAQWSKMFHQVMTDGQFFGYLNALKVYADSTGMQVKVKSGGAWLRGHYYENDEEETLAVSAAHATLTRWDQVVLEVDWSKDDYQISTKMLAGTAAASPALPALTQNATVWQIPMAKIVVGAAVTTIAPSNVVDLRIFTSPGGGSGGGSHYPAINKSGSQILEGMVMVFDGDHDNALKTTNIQGDPSVQGVSMGVTDDGRWDSLRWTGISGCWLLVRLNARTG